MAEEKMSQVEIYKGSYLLHSLALAAAGDQRDSLDKPEEFRNAIAKLFSSGTARKDNPLVWVLKKILLLTGIPQLLRIGFRKLAREGIKNRSHKTFANSFATFQTKTLPIFIENLQQVIAKESDHQVRHNLTIIAQKLNSKNRVMEAALFIETMEAGFAAFGLDKDALEEASMMQAFAARLSDFDNVVALNGKLYWRRPFDQVSRLVVESVIPEFMEVWDYNQAVQTPLGYLGGQKELGPITLELLEDLESVGLLETAKPKRLLKIGTFAQKWGKAYESKRAGWLAKPSPSDISAVPFASRERAWRQAKDEYETRKHELAPLMASYKTELGLTNPEQVATKSNFDALLHIVEAELNHPTTQAILEFKPEPGDLRSFGSYGYESDPSGKMSRYLEGLKALLEFSHHSPERYGAYFQTVANEFYTFLTGLYQLEEKS